MYKLCCPKKIDQKSNFFSSKTMKNEFHIIDLASPNKKTFFKDLLSSINIQK